MAKATAPVTITLPLEDLEALKRHANTLHRGPETAWREPTYGTCVRQAVREYLERHAKRRSSAAPKKGGRRHG